LTVSLPLKWAKRIGLKKGDELEVNEKDNSLLIETKSSPVYKQTSFDIGDSSPRYIMRRIGIAYRAGYDELKINFNNASEAKIAQEKIGKCIGFEIIEQGSKYIIAKDIGGTLKSEFDNVLRRVFFMLLAMSKDSYSALANNKLKSLDEVIEIEETIDKLTNFCKRIINRGEYMHDKSSYIYSIVSKLEKISDEYRDICFNYRDKNSLKLSKETLDFYNKIDGFLESLYNFFYNFNERKGIELSNIRTDLYKKGIDLMKKQSKEESLLIHFLINISIGISDIAGLIYPLHF